MTEFELAMNAGARAIEQNKRLAGTFYCCDPLGDNQEIAYKEAARILRTTDAVEVVRCKDCDYGYLWTNFFGRKIGKCAFLIGDNQCVPEDGYCYVGKRKEQ